ncbi:hypothetical protein GGR58DRAFT_502998 [Xylaria digitata]|nr:hypothetical protein GGR58DRAFT_502998 [Xylaria digitata]
MSSDHAIFNQITASDMMAVAKVNWEKLAAKAGFQDGATAKAHYEPFLNPDHPGDALRKQQSSYDNKAASMRVKTEDVNKHDTRNRFTSCYPSDLEDGEV